MPLDAFIQTCFDAHEEADLFEHFLKYLDGFGSDIMSYHLVVENLRHVSLQSGSIFHTFHPEWVATYLEKDYFVDDPILAATLHAREPFNWFDAGKLIPLTPKQQNFLRDFRASGIVDGYAVPVFAGLGTAAFFGVGSRKHKMPLSARERFELMAACHQVHNRWMELRGHPTERSCLSKRETEVLTLVAKGKTNAAIAAILGVSDHTIDTLVRRSFVKLGVTDRLSASLKAIGMGAVQI
jgi:DNA-binding CsgD family transcriptional regulator